MVGKGSSCYLNNNDLFQYSIPPDKFGSEMAQMAMLCGERGLIRRRRFLSISDQLESLMGDISNVAVLPTGQMTIHFTTCLFDRFIFQRYFFFRSVRSLKYYAMRK